MTPEQLTEAIETAVEDATAAAGEAEQSRAATALYQLADQSDQVEGVGRKTGKLLRIAAYALGMVGDADEAAKSLRTALAAVEKRVGASKRKAA